MQDLPGGEYNFSALKKNIYICLVYLFLKIEIKCAAMIYFCL